MVMMETRGTREEEGGAKRRSCSVIPCYNALYAQDPTSCFVFVLVVFLVFFHSIITHARVRACVWVWVLVWVNIQGRGVS